MIKQIVGGIIVVVIGGTTYAVSQTDVANNLSKDTGMTQSQAREYVNNIPKSDLESFSKVGGGLVNDGNAVNEIAAKIDCANYKYDWESDSLSCAAGRSQMQTIGKDEIVLGKCYESLGTDLGSTAGSAISTCVDDSTTVEADYKFPIMSVVGDKSNVTNLRDAVAYNKSVLEAATQSNH